MSRTNGFDFFCAMHVMSIHDYRMLENHYEALAKNFHRVPVGFHRRKLARILIGKAAYTNRVFHSHIIGLAHNLDRVVKGFLELFYL